ncbi:MAG: L-threonylcarbamoyladenylate synthase [Candidatus Aenigmatarchaeota archaeon]
MTLILKDPKEEGIEQAAKRMKDGETCIYPTETCYGLGTNALDEKAVKKIYNVKERDEEKKLSCLVPSLEEAEKYCNLSRNERKVCERFMPGPLTLVAEKKDNVPDLLNKDFVFRISSNKVANKLSEKAGVPLVATSANFSGTEGRYSLGNISMVIKERVDVIIDHGKLKGEEPSTVVKVEDNEVKVFREGPVSKGEIERFLNI